MSKKTDVTITEKPLLGDIRQLMVMDDPLKRDFYLPSKDVLVAKLHESIQHAKQRMVDHE